MKIIFWATPTFSLPILESIIKANHEILAIVTQPDKRRGRGNKILGSPIKEKAKELGIKIFNPDSVRKDLEFQNDISKLPADLYVVVAYGQILPVEVLNIPPLGCWNIHASLLPKWRGAAPIQWSLLSGDKTTGVTIMAMEKGLDTGPILLQEEIKIDLNDNAKSLSSKLSNLSSKLINISLNKIGDVGIGNETERYKKLNLMSQESIPRSVQYARPFTKEDMLINWEDSAIHIHRKIMGLYPYAYTYWKGKRLKILNSIPYDEYYLQYLSEFDVTNVTDQNEKHIPGEISNVLNGIGLIVAAKDSQLFINKVKLEGKSESEKSVLIQQLFPNVGDYFTYK